jgi:hypothetical protein
MRRAFCPSLPSAAKRHTKQQAVRYNYNPNPWSIEKDPLAATFPVLSPAQLVACKSPPSKCRTLARNFIEDSLYNPHYGYFTRQATIFDPDLARAAALHDPGGFDFARIRNAKAFDTEIARRYLEIEGPGAQEALPGTAESSARQIWHTPTELFKVGGGCLLSTG